MSALLDKAQRLSQACAVPASTDTSACPTGNPICDTKWTLCGHCAHALHQAAETAARARQAQHVGCCMECGTPTNRARHSGEFYTLCKHCQYELRKID